MHSNWYMMTSVMPITFSICILLVIIQTKSFKWYSSVIDQDIYKKKRELFCLYGVYIMGSICSIQCFLCHISNYFPEWYCIYGMSVCIIMYIATKSFLYGFFLERAKCIKTDKSIQTILPKIIHKYILPIYIAGYFSIYLILCPLTFRGEVVSSSMIEHKSIPTACLFGEYHSWVFILSAAVDILNSIFFSWLFTYPLYDAIKRKENFTDSTAHQVLRNEFLRTMKYNIICSSICSMSSVTYLLIMALAKTSDIAYYLWFGGSMDIMINSFCIFLMVGCNRQYINYVLGEYCKQTKIDKTKAPNLEPNNSMVVARTMVRIDSNSVIPSSTTCSPHQSSSSTMEIIPESQIQTNVVADGNNGCSQQIEENSDPNTIENNSECKKQNDSVNQLTKS